SLLVGFNANHAIPQASVSILNRDQSLVHEKVDLTPAQTWLHEVLNADAQAKYSLEIKDASGAILLHQTEGEYDWTPAPEIHVGPEPVHGIPDRAKRTYDDWLEFAKNEELNGANLTALETYEETLKKFPNSFEAAKAAGRLSAALLRFDEAKNLLEPVHARD